MSLVGRLAPSPTGVLHLGNARSFLLAWLDARQAHGRLLLRVEDLDGPRNKPGAIESTVEDLQWLGLDWDGPMLLQSERQLRHREILHQLLDQGDAYPCICTRKDVEQAASAPHPGEEGPVYPGTCRHRFTPGPQGLAEAEEVGGRKPFLRFCVRPGVVEVQDRFCGRQQFDVHNDLGDFPIWRREDEAAYHLAVVVDDHDQGVNRVVRGNDLLSSAARQIQLHQALDWELPSYAHVPLVLGKDGKRLAKRHGDTSLREFRRQGIGREQILGWLGESCGMPVAEHHGDLDKMLELWNWQRLPSDPVTWLDQLG